jgi:hypothetical protein
VSVVWVAQSAQRNMCETCYFSARTQSSLKLKGERRVGKRERESQARRAH